MPISPPALNSSFGFKKMRRNYCCIYKPLSFNKVRLFFGMKAKTDTNIYHNTVVVVNQKAFDENILISLMDKTRVASQERPGWVLRKPYAPALGFKKHASFAPASQKRLGFRLRSPLLRRGTMPAPPSNGFFHP
jgi:hypothetical protein